MPPSNLLVLVLVYGAVVEAEDPQSPLDSLAKVVAAMANVQSCDVEVIERYGSRSVTYVHKSSSYQISYSPKEQEYALLLDRILIRMGDTDTRSVYTLSMDDVVGENRQLDSLEAKYDV